MMLHLIITALFIISVAIAAGSIIIASQLRTIGHHESVSTLLYMQVFYFMFGFYALWGQVIVVAYVTPLVEKVTLERIHEITVLLGTPFIIFGWFMLIKMVRELAGKRIAPHFPTIYLIGNISFLIFVGLLNTRLSTIKTLDILTYYFIGSNLIYSILVVLWLMRSKNKQSIFSKESQRKPFALGILLSMIIQNGLLFIYNENIWFALIFIFVFFAGTAFVPVYMRYTINQRQSATNNIPHSFEEFCSKFEISPREKDIIREICNGLSNQQIADKLFISLQTVKDHTHRIYGKTFAISRLQLMKMIQELSN